MDESLRDRPAWTAAEVLTHSSGVVSDAILDMKHDVFLGTNVTGVSTSEAVTTCA